MGKWQNKYRVGLLFGEDRMNKGDLVEWKAFGSRDIGVITEINGKWVKIIWMYEPQHSGDYRMDHEQLGFLK